MSAPLPWLSNGVFGLQPARRRASTRATSRRRSALRASVCTALGDWLAHMGTANDATSTPAAKPMAAPSAQRHTACLGSAPPAAARALSAAAEANRQRPRPRSAARLRSFPFKSRPSEIPRNLFITAPGRIEQGDRDAA